ncbi:MAG: crosslink repair DNA glycosylase YcaQ family protein [Deltaproteobacteria bacterium]
MARERRIEPRESRRILLAAQELAAPPGRRAGPKSVQRLIEKLGFVQIDSIQVVEQAQHLILHARLEGDHRAALKTLREKDRALFEHWTHDASLIPTRWYAHWQPRFLRWQEYFERRTPEESGVRQKFESMLATVEARVRTGGALRSRDLDDLRDGHKAGSWWDWHPGKAGLERLWLTGRLAVARRERLEKVYDLSERIHAQAHAAPAPTPEEHRAWACRTALERLGVATAKEIADFWKSIPVREARAVADAGVRRGEWESVVLADTDGRERAAYATPQAHRLARVQPVEDRIRLLAPFDPVIRDRDRLLRRFGFDYRFEAYVPQKKRVYGYYVLPMLCGDRFVGRLDPKYDRKQGELIVRGPFWEEQAGTPAHARMLRDALDRLAGFLGAKGWHFSK